MVHRGGGGKVTSKTKKLNDHMFTKRVSFNIVLIDFVDHTITMGESKEFVIVKSEELF